MKIHHFLTALAALFLFSCTPEAVRVVSVTLSTKALTLEVGESETLTASVSPKDASNLSVIWISDNSSIAKVSLEGVVTAISPGTAKITAKADDGGYSDVCVVTVPNPFVFVDGVTLDPSSVTLHEGEWMELTATVTPANADDPTLQWTSNKPDVAQITSDGVLLALKPGKAVVTVTTADGGKTASCEVTVKDRVIGLRLEPEKTEMYVSDEMDIKALLEPEDSPVKVSFSTTNPAVVSVDSETGHVKALSAGYAVVCASTDYKGLVAFSKIRVRSRLQSVTVTSSTREINVGGTVNMTAAVVPGDLPDTQLTWTSSNTDVAAVDANGVVSAKIRGTAIITATVQNGLLDSQYGSCEIKVIQPVTTITVSPTSLEMYEGDEISMEKLNITLAPTDADDATWKATSSDETVVTVSDGKIRAQKDGKATISIFPNNPASESVKAEVSVTVRAKVSGIVISGNKNIKVGESLQLSAAVKPANANQDVKWSSSNPEVATVDQKGLVTANKTKGGATIITVTSLENTQVSETCEVVVEDIAITSIELDRTYLPLKVGDKAKLTATVKPENTNLDKGVTWKSDNPLIARVSEKGDILAIKSGTATITVTSVADTKITKTCEVIVEDIGIQSLELNKSILTLKVGDKETLIATILPAETTLDKGVTWVSEDPSIATVSDKGEVTAVASGETTITVTSKGDPTKVKYCGVLVSTQTIAVTGVTLNKLLLSLEIGNSETLHATIAPENATDKTVTWSSSNSAVATVDGSGKVTAVASGIAMITVTTKDGGKTATCLVTVPEPAAPTVPVSSISLSQTAATLTLGQSVNVTVTVLPTNATDPSWECSSSNETVATVTKTSSGATIQAGSLAGNATITFRSTTNPTITATVQITVKAQIIPVSNIVISPSSLDLYLGQTKQVMATVSGKGGAEPDNNNIVWTVPQGGNVTIDTKLTVSGNAVNVTGVVEGKRRLIATSEDGNAETYIFVTVTKNTVASVTLPVSSLTLKKGETYDLIATVTAADPSFRASNPNVTWSTSDSKVASVSSGRITAIAAGTATITVTSLDDSSKKAICSVTVLDSGTGNGGSEGLGFDDWTFE